VTLQITPAPGCYGQRSEFDILQADGGLSGIISKIDMGSILINPSLSYSSNKLTLSIERENLANLGFSGNSQQVAQSLDALISNGDTELCSLIGEMLFLSKDEISRALNQMQITQ